MSRRAALRVVDAPAPLRDGQYIRVSAVMGRVDERFLSPDIQADEIGKARGRGPASVLVDTFRDIDVSTARVPASRRPGLQSALTAAREGRIDRLWILVLDRFDRDVAAMQTFDEIARLGVEVWTPAGRVDVETPEGYLSTTMQLAIARYQRDRIGAAWRQTHEHRVAAGLTHTGKPKFGYVYDPGRRRHVPDPDTAPALAETYARYLAGESVYSLVRWLNDAGVRTTEGGLWSGRSLRRVLDSGFAAGFVPFRGDLHPGVHEPLIDAATWEAYQAARRRRAVQRGSERSQYVLSGLVRCSCGSAMVAGQYGAARAPKYRCKAAAERGTHAGGYVMASYVEQAVRDWLADIAADVDKAADAQRLAEARVQRRQRDADKARRDVGKLEEQLVRLTRQLAAGVVPASAYAGARREIEAELEQAHARLRDAADDQALGVLSAPVAAELVADWDVLPVQRRRELLRRIIKHVEVTPGRPRAAFRVVPVWE